MLLKSLSIAVVLSCLAYVVAAQPVCNDPEACNFFEGSTSNTECFYPSYLLPIPGIVVLNDNYSRANFQGGGTPALEFCFDFNGLPEGYGLANQSCVTTVIANDPFCVQSSWDLTCQEAYELCCPANQWYLPASAFTNSGGPVIAGGGGGGIPPVTPFQPAILSCSPPAGYILAADQACVESVIANDLFCVFLNWDAFCQNTYTTCAYGCENPTIYIPDPCGASVLPLGGSGGGTPAIVSCDGPFLGYIEAPSQSCAFDVIANDSFCIESTWDSQCDNTYTGCTSGCTYSFSCNYDPLALVDDGSCGYPGCTDSSAINFDPNATCDNALCMFPESTACSADLDNNGVINVSDLLIFLPLFGGFCAY
jgi:hypothetical protein